MSGLVRRLLTLPLLTALLGIGLVAAPTAAPAHAASAPGGLRAVAVSSNAVALTWNRVSGAKAYRVQFSKSSSMSSAQTVDVDTNSVEWTYLNPEPSANSGRLKPTTTYYFRVKAITKVDLSHSAKSLSKYGSKLKVKTSGTGSRTYLAPRGLKATARNSTSAYLSWNSRGPGIHYRVRYSTSSNLAGAKTKVFDYAGGILSGLKAGATHYFRVETISRDNRSTLSPRSAIVSFKPRNSGSPAIKIANYNICGSACGNWGGREPGMLDSLQRQAPDLIATQESTNSDDLINDYNDLANRSFERIANKKHAGLAFDSDRFSLVDSGINPWDADSSKDAVWAILADRKDRGRKLFVVSVHFTNGGGGDSKRKSEAAELVRMIAAHGQGLPTVVAGDFNVSKRKADHPAVYSTVSKAGLVDPLGNPSDSRYVHDSATVEHRIDVGYASANQYSYSTGANRHALRSKWENGYNVDYIWHSKGIRVGSFQVVVDLDTKGNFTGTVASDHNMLVSSVHLS